MIKKYKLVILFLSVLLIMPGFSFAATSAEIQAQIQTIMAQIQALQQQLVQLQTQQEVGTGAQWCHTFNTNLRIGDTGDEVSALQMALKSEGFSISNDEMEKAGGTSRVFYLVPANFGESTAAAVTGFQEKYRSEILTPIGLSNGTGYVGSATRAILNKLYGCATSSVVLPAPVLSSVSPTSLAANQAVTFTINGSNFQSGATAYYYSGSTVLPVSLLFDSSTQLRAVFANGINSGTWTFYIKNPDGKTSGTLSVVANPSSVSVPAITVLSPNGGEVWQQESTQTIRWDIPKTLIKDGVNYGLTLALIDGPTPGLIYAVKFNKQFPLPGNELTWKVFYVRDGEKMPIALGKYKVELILYNLAENCPLCRESLDVKSATILFKDTSDAPFSIVAPDTAALSFSVVTDKSTYTPDEQIQITITAKNSSSATKVLNFTSGCQVGYAVAFYDSSQNQVCTKALTSVSIAPYGSHTWKLTHNPIMYRIPAGSYKLTGRVVGYGEAATPITIKDATIPSITVTSPNGGENWTAGQTARVTLQWSASCSLTSFSISLFKGGSFVQTINPNISAGFCTFGQLTISYYTTWSVPLTLQAGNDYKIRVSSGSAIYDDSNAPFSVVSSISSVVLPAPVLSSVSPTSVAANQAVTFTITGQNFQSGATAYYYSGSTVLPVSLIFDSSTQMRAVFPSGIAAGTWAFYVKNPDGRTSGTLTVVASIPTVTSFTVSDSSSYTGAKFFSWTVSNATCPNCVSFTISCYVGLTITDATTGNSFACGDLDRRVVTDGSIHLKFVNSTAGTINGQATLSPLDGQSKTVVFSIPPSSSSGAAAPSQLNLTASLLASMQAILDQMQEMLKKMAR